MLTYGSPAAVAISLSVFLVLDFGFYFTTGFSLIPIARLILSNMLFLIVESICPASLAYRQLLLVCLVQQ